MALDGRAGRDDVRPDDVRQLGGGGGGDGALVAAVVAGAGAVPDLAVTAIPGVGLVDQEVRHGVGGGLVRLCRQEALGRLDRFAPPPRQHPRHPQRRHPDAHHQQQHDEG